MVVLLYLRLVTPGIGKRGSLFGYSFVLLGWRWRGGGVLLFD